MNHLKGAVSKYLLQHANNPVDWYPWGEEPFEKAHRENKPVLVSIGYAACHWCHVMAHESFEDPEVAAFMNEHFVCIKVDREENPDVDQLYMDALQSLTGSGGWPLNMFVTPEKKPFYGGTYFPPEESDGRSSWMNLLQAVAKVWVENPMGIADQAEEMMNHLKRASLVGTHQNNIPDLDQELIKGIVENLLENADTAWGGFGEAPKFLGSFSLRLLLDYYVFQSRWEANFDLRTRALKQATLTLDKMISGGIYDQIGGGFFRYSVDAQWQVPHYEKMLYDNALMISALCVAYRVTKEQRYRIAIEETLAFCNRELKAKEVPGFYCSLDADANGVEGGYYLWNLGQWREALPNAHPAVSAYFDMVDQGKDWDAHGLLLALEKEEILSQYGISGEVWDRLLKDAKQRLLAYREKRSRPDIDDKLLLSWNALMNVALQDAAIALEQPDLLIQAESHLNWLYTTFCQGEHATHVYKEGKSFVTAKLDDWAFLIRAMIGMAETSENKDWLLKAKSAMEVVLTYFSFDEKPYFYFSDVRQTDIPVRKTEIYDGAEPSGNAVIAESLLILGACFGISEWEALSKRMLEGVSVTVRNYARSFSYWGLLLQYYQAKVKTLVISGDHYKERYQKWMTYYYPDVHAYFVKSAENSIPLLHDKYVFGRQCYYLCTDNQCIAMLNHIDGIRLAIKKNQ